MPAFPRLDFEAVAKKYCKSMRRAMLYGANDVARAALGMRQRTGVLRRDEFWAVRNLSFRLGPGEVLGIIGPNGSGKSTVIKMAAGILPPDAGRITVGGDVGALVEVGAGFHPEMTGRENVHLYGAMLGMGRREVAAKFDSIVEFSGVGDYLDMPVKRYSSGMYVRLGFSVAIHRQPSILLVDEVLAVGDVAFRARCYQEISRIAARGCVVFVSHSMAAISRICTSLVVLHRGAPEYFADVALGVERYFELAREGRTEELDFGVRVTDVRLAGSLGGAVIRRGSEVVVTAHLECSQGVRNPVVDLAVVDSAQNYVFQSNSEMDGANLEPLEVGRYRLEVRLPELHLGAGAYSLSLALIDGDTRRHLGWSFNVAQFGVDGGYRGVSAYQRDARWSLAPAAVDRPLA